MLLLLLALFSFGFAAKAAPIEGSGEEPLMSCPHGFVIRESFREFRPDDQFDIIPKLNQVIALEDDEDQTNCFDQCAQNSQCVLAIADLVERRCVIGVINEENIFDYVCKEFKQVNRSFDKEVLVDALNCSQGCQRMLKVCEKCGKASQAKAVALSWCKDDGNQDTEATCAKLQAKKQKKKQEKAGFPCPKGFTTKQRFRPYDPEDFFDIIPKLNRVYEDEDCFQLCADDPNCVLAIRELAEDENGTQTVENPRCAVGVINQDNIDFVCKEFKQVNQSFDKEAKVDALECRNGCDKMWKVCEECGGASNAKAIALGHCGLSAASNIKESCKAERKKKAAKEAQNQQKTQEDKQPEDTTN